MTQAKVHLVELSKWEHLDNRVLEKIQHTGFDLVHRIDMTYKVDLNLIRALISFYSFEDLCFDMNGVKIGPTLDDIARIIGFPVDGKPVTGLDYNSEDSKRFCLRLLGEGNFIGEKAKCSLKLKVLKEIFERLPDDVDGEDLDRYVRGYILYVIGCLIAPASDSLTVPSMFLGLLEDVAEVKNYAWGAALLACIHHQLSIIKKAHLLDGAQRCRVFPFCVPFLMVFFYEYVPSLLLAMYPNVVPNPLPLEFPLVVPWTRVLSKSSRNNYTKKSKDEFLLLLAEPNIIDWQPFARLPADFLPPHLVRQVDVGHTSTILICFEQMWHHLPYLCPAKWGLQENDVNNWRTDIVLRPVRRSYPQKFDWSVKCKNCVDLWNERRGHYIYNFHMENDQGMPEEQTPAHEPEIMENMDLPDPTSGSGVNLGSGDFGPWQGYMDVLGISGACESSHGGADCAADDDSQVPVMFSRESGCEGDGAGAGAANDDDSQVISPNFNTNTDGLRRGIRERETPVVLKGDFFCDALMKRIRKK